MRAKIKAFDQIPEKYKCCINSIQGMFDVKDIIVELYGSPYYIEVTCAACKKVIGDNILVYAIKNRAGNFPVETADIDERE